MSRIRQAHDYIASLDRMVSAKQVCDKFNLDDEDRRIFVMQYRMTIIRMIRVTVLRRARSLLLTTDMRIGEIADVIGYGSIYAFSEAYKGFYGHSPKQETKQKTHEPHPAKR
jgi:AraC-like DNA-binding protein